MNRKAEQERTDFVIQQVGSHAFRDDIIRALCKQYGMNWQEAEDLVLDVEIQHSNRVDPRLVPVISILGVFLMIIGVIYLLAKILLTGGTIATNWFDMTILVVVTGIALVFLILFLSSEYQNSNKESYRCPHCGYLANRRGNEDSIFVPMFKPSTCFTSKKKQKIWHNTHDSFGGPEWDTFAEFEITEFCRNCRRVRRKFQETEKVGDHRHPKPGDGGPEV